MEEMWLARDRNGDLRMYKREPLKYLHWGFWDLRKAPYGQIKLPSNIFPEVKWSDSEPTKVKLVIEK